MKKLQIFKIKNDVILKKIESFIIYGRVIIIIKIQYKESLLIDPYY